jgi:hypothetical protein
MGIGNETQTIHSSNQKKKKYTENITHHNFKIFNSPFEKYSKFAHDRCRE